jgi:APA family basic amino acid/polyamine antiporter
VGTESVGAPLTHGSTGGAFARQATGLVRQAGAWDVFVYNTNFINIAIGVAFIFLFIPAGAYPGSNVYLAILLTVAAVLPTTIVYGTLASIMPRSGGDYVYVSRTLGPMWGLAANWNYTVWSFFYIGVPAAFLGKYGISSLMRTVGVYSGNLGLVNVGSFFASPTGTFLAGFVLIAIFTAIFITGLNTYMRVQNVLFVVAMLALVAIVVVAVGANPADYTARFNAYFASVTGHGDTAGTILSSLGKNAPAAASFDLHDTVASMTWVFSVLGFGLASAYIGGEVKGANRSQLRGMVGSVLFSALWLLLLVAVVLRVIPYNFVGAVGAADVGRTGLGFTPVFTELVSVMTTNWFLLILIGVGFCLWSYAWLPIYIITTTRNMLAWAFDGLLPVRVSSVDERFHSPVVAIVISAGLGVVFLGVYSFNTSFATISGFFGQVWTYLLAGIAAIVLPYKLPEVFEASPVRWRLAGVPVLSIVGVLSLVGMGVIEYAYLNDPNSGISFRAPTMLLVNVAVFLSGFVFYAVTRMVRARQGIDVGLAFAEIPPE